MIALYLALAIYSTPLVPAYTPSEWGTNAVFISAGRVGPGVHVARLP